MPIQYKIFADQKLVYAIGVGKISIEDLLMHLEELARDPAYQPPMKKLVDYRNTPVLALTPEEIRIFTNQKSLHQSKFEGEKCAIVYRSDYDFGMGRVHGATVSTGIDTGTFHSLSEALNWLKLDLQEQELQISRPASP